MNKMQLEQPHRINAPDVVAEDFDGQVVILNLANGHYFSLEGCAGDIWAAIEAGHAPDAILASIRADRPDMEGAGLAFVTELLKLELILPDAAAPAPSVPVPAAWLGEPPRLEVYKDLADLIYADPIHDVDEQAGWPKPREES